MKRSLVDRWVYAVTQKPKHCVEVKTHRKHLRKSSCIRRRRDKSNTTDGAGGIRSIPAPTCPKMIGGSYQKDGKIKGRCKMVEW